VSVVGDRKVPYEVQEFPCVLQEYLSEVQKLPYEAQEFPYEVQEFPCVSVLKQASKRNGVRIKNRDTTFGKTEILFLNVILSLSILFRPCRFPGSAFTIIILPLTVSFRFGEASC
jgi:hypothetical protein